MDYKNQWEKIFNKRNGNKDVTTSFSSISFKKTFKVINVVGTNGKGSVSSYLADSLEKNGYKVGIFTSPHIHLPNERIKVNGQEITDKEFFDIYNSIDKDLMFFSSLYVVAMKHFQNKGVDIAIIEAGIGGEFDVTNTIDGEYGILTSISFDHEKMLGNTIEEITKNKLGIWNEGMKLYVPTTLPKEAVAVTKGYDVSHIQNDADDFVIRNQLLAKGFLKQEFDIDESNFNLPKGRCQIVEDNIVDVAHNQEGFIETVNHLKKIGVDYDTVVVSVRKTKNINNLKNIFSDKKIFVFKHNENYQDNNELGTGEMIDNIDTIINSKHKTLFIGGFELAALVLKRK